MRPTQKIPIKRVQSRNPELCPEKNGYQGIQNLGMEIIILSPI